MDLTNLYHITYENGKYFLGQYRYCNASRRDPYSCLIVDFKEDQKQDVYKVFQRTVLQEFETMEDELREKASFWYLIAIPCHGAYQRNIPCEKLCDALAG